MRHTFQALAFIIGLLSVQPAFALEKERNEHPPMMQGLLSPDYEMNRDSSGTNWIPDSSPMHSLQFKLGQWDAMFHANILLRYTNQNTFEDSKRGDEDIDSLNWFMLMARKPLGEKGQIALRGMFSLEPITVGGGGYPLLLQTGETWEGQRLIDHQHPHDLFGELSIIYSRRFNQAASGFVYFGLPGEPALGPAVYFHRPSAINIPDAPLGHHWQDSTHITFGVLTGGIVFRDFKLDASFFNGREPDENRYDIDGPAFNSLSARLSWNQDENISAQVSHGQIDSPEAIEPDIDVRRTTASVIWNRPLDGGRNLALSFVWGRNDPDEADAQDSFLLEGDYSFGKNALFGRMELVEKPAEDLVIANSDDIFNVAALSLGAAHEVYRKDNFFASLGAFVTVNIIEDELKPFYGDLPFSFQVLIKIAPSLMEMKGHRM
ncbi:MAG: hypothetical protein IT362_11465 [Deltaproteobacteria bacterium]|nr:hypothetical protein [Deltaproteobacteria bacterium]